MGIDFSIEQWDRIKEISAQWWAGELKRPLIHVRCTGNAPGRSEPELPWKRFTAFYDLSVSAEDIVDRWDYDLSTLKFMGDAFPYAWPSFGPGVFSAFLGAEIHTDDRTCWFHPVNNVEIDEISLSYNQENPWLNRIKDIYRVSLERWEGKVQLGMTDLGGNLDILSTFRPSEKLHYDIFDHPEEVKKKTWEAHELWWRCFNELDDVLQPLNPGYTAWTPIFSTEPYYMLQCDFCFMISSDMFNEFVKPELKASCQKLSNAFYHLDGPGQLPHLDSLLEIEELKGIQWIPGAGVPDEKHWPEVYRKIRDAGKLIQIFGDFDVLDAVSKQLGSPEGIVLIYLEDDLPETEVIDALKKHGAL